ncbi:hypothetical protein RF55_10705 [Lasius niger]|uniref:Axoneme-associated protein n=1 Tax=Lasius niger TaxID=67767 RepID=A0A0J7KGU8_LASNI|nr:hypothetical protein RF55_10705 [Lasius niger]
MVVEAKVDSDHYPLTVWIREEGIDKKMKKGKRLGGRKKWIWTEEGRKEFAVSFGERKEQEEGIERDWEDLKGRITKALGKMERQRGGNGRRGWWDEECKEEKTRVRKELRKWRRLGRSGDKYKEEKRIYKLLCEGKKRKELERWTEEVKEAMTEGQVWKIVNRERKRRSRVNEGIEIKEWNDYFKRLLGGIEWRVVKGKGGGMERWGSGDKEGGDRKSVKKIKGWEGNEGRRDSERGMEVWEERVEGWLWEICNRVWRGRGGRKSGERE